MAMPGRYYRKLSLTQSPRGVVTWMQTLLRDFGGVWPVYADLGLELCQVHNLRFDDPWIYAGWVVYTTPIPQSAAPLMLDWHYSAATVELYDVPTGSALYLTDGQEPGGYAARPIGEAFTRFGEFVAVRMGQSPRRDMDTDARLVWLEPTDQLVVTWLHEEQDVGLAQIARRLSLSPREVAGRINALGRQGWQFPRRDNGRGAHGE